MPNTLLKNHIYGFALPFIGKRCRWEPDKTNELSRLLWREHVVGGTLQTFDHGEMSDCFSVGYVCEEEERKASPNTIYRTASIAKTVCALLVFRLQTLGLLNVEEDISDFFGYFIRSPFAPEIPITLGMMLSHTSGIRDSTSYYEGVTSGAPLFDILKQNDVYLKTVPGTTFLYSNFAAGMIGCMLECRFKKSIEKLAQEYLFRPFNLDASFDVLSLDRIRISDSYRILPSSKAFSAEERKKTASNLLEPSPETHYSIAAGNLYITAPSLAKLVLVACNGGDGFVDKKSLTQMQTPILPWKRNDNRIKHGMGLLVIDDPSLSSSTIWGHQGFAYGAVNGFFFDRDGNGFCFQNSGASEQGDGHLSILNRELIRLLIGRKK